MHLVALTRIAGAVDAALGPIAAAVGSSAYDLRLVMNAGFPAVVLVADDGERAAGAVRELRKMGHGSVVVDRARITPSVKMIAVRAVALGAEELSPAEGSDVRLPYADVACLLRASHASTTHTVDEVKERKFRPGMALATGGLVMTKTTTREIRSTHEERQQVLYLFRRSAERPWILRERETNYAGLGPRLQPSSILNFTTCIAELRARAPSAGYDESLLKTRPIRGVPAGIEATDLLAHVLAAHFAGQ